MTYKGKIIRRTGKTYKTKKIRRTGITYKRNISNIPDSVCWLSKITKIFRSYLKETQSDKALLEKNYICMRNTTPENSLGKNKGFNRFL